MPSKKRGIVEEVDHSRGCWCEAPLVVSLVAMFREVLQVDRRKVMRTTKASVQLFLMLDAVLGAPLMSCPRWCTVRKRARRVVGDHACGSQKMLQSEKPVPLHRLDNRNPLSVLFIDNLDALISSARAVEFYHGLLNRRYLFAIPNCFYSVPFSSICFYRNRKSDFKSDRSRKY